MTKKIVLLLLLISMLCCVLSSCVVFEIIEFANNILGFLDGEGGDTNNNFEINFQLPDPNRCTNHAIVPLEAIAPTCRTPGHSAGQVCSKCGTVIVAQVELPTLEHVYDGVYDRDCNNCGYIRELKCEHIETKILEAKDPTCTTTGRTSGEVCLGCSKIIAGYDIIETTEHIYDSERDDTCNDCGYVRKLECFHDVTQKLEAKAPTCTETGLTKGKSCVHCGEVLLSQQEIPMTDHVESDWIVDKAPSESEVGEIHTECTMCGIILRSGTLDKIDAEADKGASFGLAFALNDDKNSYSVVDLGNCTDTNVIIPRYYNGLPVTKIGDGAFLNRSEITSIVVPEGVLNIGNGAFRECVSLASISLPSTLTSIGEYAFYNCALTSIALPEGLGEIKQYTFYSCDLESIDVPYGVLSIGEGAFTDCSSLKAITLPSSLENIGKKAFYNVTGVVSITIPRSVKVIGDRAFNNDGFDVKITFNIFNSINKIGAYAFTTGSTINFKGTGDDWNKILIDPRNYQYNVVTLDGSFVD